MTSLYLIRGPFDPERDLPADSNRTLVHCDAGGGSCLQYHYPMAGKARLRPFDR